MNCHPTNPTENKTMTKTIALLSFTLVALIAAASAKAGSCCAASEAPPQAATTPGTGKALAAPMPVVLEAYAKIQAALAADTIAGVTEAAQTIGQTLTEDPNKTLPAAIPQVETLAKAKTITEARAAFKALNETLVRFLAKEKVQTSQYQVVYCDMAKATWLQTDKAIKNPYYGKAMLACGQIVGSF
jgi:Cu(I)/Ag(I) efflux system membrane fusion protein